MIENLKVGTDGELAVAAKMAQLGYNISFPMGGTPYDLIAEKDGVCVRVQVKAASFQKKGSYRVNLSYGRLNKGFYNKSMCDVIVAYVPYSRDYEGIHEDGFYVITVKEIQRLKKFHATLFPAGMGRGQIRTCRWEQYRDAWATI